jgi:hypothetical protein
MLNPPLGPRVRDAILDVVDPHKTGRSEHEFSDVVTAVLGVLAELVGGLDHEHERYDAKITIGLGLSALVDAKRRRGETIRLEYVGRLN